MLTFGGICAMTRAEAMAILQLPIEEAIETILGLAEKAEKYDQLCGAVSASTPSAMTPPYLKAAAAKRRKRPGRKNGHPGVARLRPDQIDDYKEHRLHCCPQCQGPLKEPVQQYKRLVEDIPAIEKPQVTEHTVYGYWCSICRTKEIRKNEKRELYFSTYGPLSLMPQQFVSFLKSWYTYFFLN